MYMRRKSEDPERDPDVLVMFDEMRGDDAVDEEAAPGDDAPPSDADDPPPAKQPVYFRSVGHQTLSAVSAAVEDSVS